MGLAGKLLANSGTRREDLCDPFRTGQEEILPSLAPSESRPKTASSPDRNARTFSRRLRHISSLFILLPAFLFLLSCGPAPSGTPAQATVYSGSAYPLSGPTALVSVGGVPWYANTTGNTLVGLVPQTGYSMSGYTPAVTLSNPLTSSFSPNNYDLSGPVAMTVDLSGNLWVTSQKNNSLVSLSSCFTNSNPFFGYCSLQSGYLTNLNTPSGIAADPSGNIWVANKGNDTLLRLEPVTCNFSCPTTDYSPYDSTNYSPTLYCLSGSSCTTMGAGCVLASPSAIASDSNGNIWVLNTSPESLTEIVGGKVSSCQNFSASELFLDNPVALAPDTSGDLVVANQGKNSSTDSGSVVYIPSGCTPGSCTPVVLSGSSMGIDQPVSASFAPNGDLWVAEAGNSSATDMPSGCLSGGACQPIIYEGTAYPFGTPTSILAIGQTIWVLGTSALVAITPSGP